MDRASNIMMRMGILIREMYELGKEEGYEEGYEEAMDDFGVPDL